MNVRAHVLITGFLLSSSPCAMAAAEAPWNVYVSAARGPVRTVSAAPHGKAVASEIMGGPTSGSDSAWLLHTRMPAGAHGPSLFTLTVDHLYLVLSGKMTIQIGTDTFTAGPNTGVYVPPGVPHQAWNAGTEAESHLEVIAPAPTRDLLAMLKPAQPRKVENAASFIHEVPVLTDLKPGLNGQQLASRALTGSQEQMRIDNTLPGQGGPASHIHRFEQVYFVKEGTMTFDYGLETYKVTANSFVIIPPGVVHTNRNESAAVERHAVFLLPEPEPNTGPADTPVEIKRNPPARQ